MVSIPHTNLYICDSDLWTLIYENKTNVEFDTCQYKEFTFTCSEAKLLKLFQVEWQNLVIASECIHEMQNGMFQNEEKTLLTVHKTQIQ